LRSLRSQLELGGVWYAEDFTGVSLAMLIEKIGSLIDRVESPNRI
jgi:hypothetical protein